MDEQSGFTFADGETGEEAYCSVRKTGDLVGLALSLARDGDIEVFLSKADLDRLIALLQTLAT